MPCEFPISKTDAERVINEASMIDELLSIAKTQIEWTANSFYKTSITEYILHHMKLSQTRAEKSYKKLARYADIRKEFYLYIMDDEVFTPNPIKVEGFTAQHLATNYPLSALGAYNYLIYLREMPPKALVDLKTGLPAKICLSKKNVKMKGENMNLELFWSAFGSIGTMLACIIAVLQPIVERYIERKKKVIVSFETNRVVVLPSLEDIKQEICTVFLTNNGNSSIYVTNISLLVDGQYLRQIAVPCDPVHYQEFPKELRVGEQLDFNFSKGKLHDQLQNFSAGLPVSIVVSFTDGKVYKQKTKSTVGDIINGHQCDYKVEKYKQSRKS